MPKPDAAYASGMPGRSEWSTAIDNRQPLYDPRPGLNFGLSDYLALSCHPAILAARLQPPQEDCAPRLETRLAAFLRLPHVASFDSGRTATRQALGALLHPGDDVIIDAGAHPAAFDMAALMRTTIHRSPDGSLDAVERRVIRLARQPGHRRTVIIVPAVSAARSRIADLSELTALTRQFRAVLVVDVTHDIGAMGPEGAGVMEIQSCLGRIDLILGSFSKTFAAAGGFAAFQDPDLISLATRTSSGRLSPHEAAVISAALDMVAGSEGRRRRRTLHSLTLRLRNHLMADGIRALGQASPRVLISLPLHSAVPATELLHSAGPRVTLLQAPKVPRHVPRWCIQLSAAHGPADIDDLAELVRDVTRAMDSRPTRVHLPA